MDKKQLKKSKGTVILGLSGGVDSSVAAFLLKKEGYNVIGIFLRSYPDEEKYLDSVCPFKEDKNIANEVSKKIGIGFKKLDYRLEYLKDVIEPMFKKYSKGQTPNPDVCCNNLIKFPALWKFAKTINADFISTGHYARIKKTSKGYELLQGIDSNKDQSYFLYKLTQKDLSHTLFPLGNYTKTQIRDMAKRNKFPNWNKQGSRGICFIGNLDFKEFLKRAIPEKEGIVKSPENKIIGRHPGSFYFTIGERVRPKKGIVIDSEYNKLIKNKKIYVAKKLGNTLVIAPENHLSLKKSKIIIKNFRKINPSKEIPKVNLKARIRHLGKLLPGKLTKKNSKYLFTLKKPEKEVADGQAIVLYHNKSLIAGGVISSSC